MEAVELFCQSKGRLASPAGLNPGWASEHISPPWCGCGAEWTEDEEGVLEGVSSKRGSPSEQTDQCTPLFWRLISARGPCAWRGGNDCTLGYLEGTQSAVSSLAPWSPDQVQKQPSRFPQVLVKQGGVDKAGVVDMLPSEKMLDRGVGSGERWGGQGSLRGSPLQVRANAHPRSRKCYRMYAEIIT